MALASIGRMGIVWGFSGFGGVVRNPPPFCGTLKFFALALLVCEFEDRRALICKNREHKHKHSQMDRDLDKDAQQL